MQVDEVTRTYKLCETFVQNCTGTSQPSQGRRLNASHLSAHLLNWFRLTLFLMFYFIFALQSVIKDWYSCDLPSPWLCCPWAVHTLHAHLQQACKAATAWDSVVTSTLCSGVEVGVESRQHYIHHVELWPENHIWKWKVQLRYPYHIIILKKPPLTSVRLEAVVGYLGF